MKGGTPDANCAEEHNFNVDKVEDGEQTQCHPEEFGGEQDAFLRPDTPGREGEGSAHNAPEQAGDGNRDSGAGYDGIATGEHASAVNDATGGADKRNFLIVFGGQVDGDTNGKHGE